MYSVEYLASLENQHTTRHFREIENAGFLALNQYCPILKSMLNYAYIKNGWYTVLTNNEIISRLFSMSDEKYRDFEAKLAPTLNKDTVIGVRTPKLKNLAKEMLAGDYAEFLSDVPHKYFEENQLHAFIISGIKDFGACMDEVCRLLPFVDNWATCDQLIPKVFAKNREKLLPYINKWLDSGHTYTVRFGVGCLMRYFTDSEFNISYPEKVASINTDDYYINMMCAWYFATALTKQYNSIIPFFKERKLNKWVHNKAIQKAVESFRVKDEQKAYLKTLKY